MNRLRNFLAISVLSFVSLGVNAEVLSGYCGAYGENITWILDTETGILTIEGTGLMVLGNNCGWQYYRNSIKEVNIGDGVTDISERAFYGCSEIRTISTPSSLTTIGAYAFYNCSKMNSINIPPKVNKIGNNAFRGCYSLESIALPEYLDCIESSVFSGCNSLNSGAV